ncbi:hypothetical protein D3C73_1399260 [compost metagenome]
MPTHLALFTVVNSVKDKYTPKINGMTNAIVKASIVGNAKRGKYFFIDFCMLSFSLSRIEKMSLYRAVSAMKLCHGAP